MPRAPRIEFPGALYHVYTRGNNRQPIFMDDQDRLTYLEGLKRTHERLGLTPYAFVLMDNHVHHLMGTPEAPLRRVMQTHLTRYARYFNIRHNRSGHLFQGRYRAILCDKDAYLLELIRYIHLNPTRAGLVKNPAKWPWSSHRVYLGLEKAPWIDSETVLSMFHRKISKARKLYERFVLEAVDMKPDPAFEPTQDMAIAGGAEFRARVCRKLARPARRKRDKKSEKRRLEDILEKVARQHNFSVSALRDAGRQKEIVQARLDVLLEAMRAGWRQTDVAKALQRGNSWATHALRRHDDRRGPVK